MKQQIKEALRIREAFASLTQFERVLWLSSVCVVTAAFALSGFADVLSYASAMIGVTSLIFYAKGHVLGQILTIAFSIVYGVVSFFFRYYGETLTYLCMTLPMAVVGLIAWIKHPFEQTSQVEISAITKGQIVRMIVCTFLVTAAFYFVLKALGNVNLAFSTVSISTSFLAAYLTYCRSPYYALAYAANDIVLIVLWSLASYRQPSYLPMIACFGAFLANDTYAFYNWRRMHRAQRAYRRENSAQEENGKS